MLGPTMITRLDISNYKSIKSLSLDLRPFMVLVGPNGAGKTNVVRALELLGNLLQRGTTDPVREQGWAQMVHREQRPARGGLKLGAKLRIPSRLGGTGQLQAQIAVTLKGKVGDHDVSVIAEEFSLTSETETLWMKWNDGAFTHDLGSDPRLWEVVGSVAPGRPGLRPSDKPSDLRKRLETRFSQGELFADTPTQLKLLNRGLGFAFNRILRQCAVTRLRLDASALRSDARFQADGDHALGSSGEGLPVAVDRLRRRKDEPAKEFQGILAALREVYPRIEDVVPETFAQGRVTLGFRERGIAEPIPLDGVSDGVLHALALLIALDQRGTGILAIEEPENALHPWSVRKILERAQASPQRQVLITTHSETVVNAVVDPESLFIVEANEQGTTVEPATNKESALSTILRETGQRLGDVWIDGSLGGVPQT
jgi:predicted ATPase